MGLADTYRLPANYEEACGLMGDGLAVPVVRHLARHILEPIVEAAAPGVRTSLERESGS